MSAVAHSSSSGGGAAAAAPLPYGLTAEVLAAHGGIFAQLARIAPDEMRRTVNEHGDEASVRFVPAATEHTVMRDIETASIAFRAYYNDRPATWGVYHIIRGDLLSWRPAAEAAILRRALIVRGRDCLRTAGALPVTRPICVDWQTLYSFELFKPAGEAPRAWASTTSVINIFRTIAPSEYPDRETGCYCLQPYMLHIARRAAIDACECADCYRARYEHVVRSLGAAFRGLRRRAPDLCLADAAVCCCAQCHQWRSEEEEGSDDEEYYREEDGDEAEEEEAVEEEEDAVVEEAAAAPPVAGGLMQYRRRVAEWVVEQAAGSSRAPLPQIGQPLYEDVAAVQVGRPVAA